MHLYRKSKIDPAPEQISSMSSFTKSISALGKKVGQKWEQIKRSSSSDLPTAPISTERWSPLRKNCAESKIETTTPVTIPSPVPRANRGRRMKSLQNIIKSFSWSGRTESTETIFKHSDAKVEKSVRFELPPLEKSVSEGALKRKPPTFEELAEKKLQLTRSIQDLELKNQALELYLSSLNRLDSQKRISSYSDELSIGSSNESMNRDDSKDPKTKPNADESGYDSDSTRRSGAASPDSQMTTSLAEYEGVDLSFCHDLDDPKGFDDTILVSEDEDEKYYTAETALLEDEKLEVENKSICEVIGALTKDGRNLSAVEMKFEEKIRSTGMLKFQVRKQNTESADNRRRAVSLHSSRLRTIVLQKGSSKLGFTIVGGCDSAKGSMGIFVNNIIPGGQAAEHGELRVKDEILAVNGKSLEGMTHGAALLTIKNAKRGKLVLHVDRRSCKS